MEIAFRPSKGHHSYSSDYNATVKLYGDLYTVYARSYLCYGHNEAQKRYWGHLVNHVSLVTDIGT